MRIAFAAGATRRCCSSLGARDSLFLRRIVGCSRRLFRSPHGWFASAVLLLLAGVLNAQAQSTQRVVRIGFVSLSPGGPTIEAFRQGLSELGYVEGRNVIVEARHAQGLFERLPETVAEVLRLNVDVLVVASTPAALAAKAATTSVPIVFAYLYDPVATGVVASLARPGGNITGTAAGVGGSGFAGKYVQLLNEAAPVASHLAVLSNSANPATAAHLPDIAAAARTLKLRFDVLDAGNAAALERALATIGASGVRGMIVLPDPFFTENRAKLVEFAANKRLPAMYFSKLFADAGGLMMYGASQVDSYRRAASYVDKILKGARPADLPVEQPTRFELVINLRTAKAFGLTIPPSVLLRADQVIE